MEFESFNQLSHQCISIDDGSSNDNGSLACDKAVLAKAPEGVLQWRVSKDDQSAAANLNACIPGGATAMCGIIGHGLPGMIGTGGGQKSGPDQTIANWNRWYWEPILAPLRGRISKLTLAGCYVGALDDGSELLSQLANVLQCTVTAPTGLMICGNGVQFEPGTLWQVAVPGKPPSALPPASDPSKHNLLLRSALDSGASKISAVIDRLEVRSSSRVGPPHAVVIRGDEARTILSLVDFDHPFSLPGTLFAQETGALATDLEDKTVVFNVYADRIVQAQQDPPVYYFVSGSFRSAFLRLI